MRYVTCKGLPRLTSKRLYCAISDTFSVEKRSDIMRSVKSSRNKSTEERLISVFRELNITGWRRNYKVKGHPDFIFPKQRIAVFVDGCFWHGHDCRNTRPSDNADYWAKKREKNMRHDREITARFENRGWTVIRIWECELKKKNLPHTAQKLLQLLGCRSSA